MNFSSVMDIAVLLVILICSFEVVRVSNAARQPWQALAFVLITIGALGWIGYDLQGKPVQWFAWLLHAGFAIVSGMVMHAQHAHRRSTDAGYRRPMQHPPHVAKH